MVRNLPKNWFSLFPMENEKKAVFQPLWMRARWETRAEKIIMTYGV